MAVFDDVLTTEGQRFLMRMLAGEIKNVEFTKLVLGDGSTSADLRSVTQPVHGVASVNIDSVVISAQNDVTITAVFKNTDISEGFYMREKALFASDGIEEVLVLYANAGSLAEFIEPSSSEVYEKIIRSIILFSQSDNVNITVKDSGYANLMDFENHINNYNNPHKVTKEQVGLGNIENLSINDQAPTFVESETLTELNSGDKLSVALGKTAKAIKDFINHITTVATESTLGHIKIGKGLQAKEGVTSVDLSALIDFFYPIGTVYESVNDVSPQVFLGGKWERFAEGRTTVGVDPNNGNYNQAGKTGGSETTTLQAAHIPVHAHTFSWTGKPSGGASTSVSIGTNGNHYHTAGALSANRVELTGRIGNIVTERKSGLSVSGVFTNRLSDKSAHYGAGTNDPSVPDFAIFDGSHGHSISGNTEWAGNHSHGASASTSLNFNNMTVSGTTGNSGNGSGFSNLQPYVTSYKWKRIA